MSVSLDLGRVDATRTATRSVRKPAIGIFAYLVFILTLCFATPGWSADLINNGGFDGATGWTFGGNNIYSTAQNHATLVGAGSSLTTVTGRNAAMSGTSSQAVSILAGAQVNAASLWAMNTWGAVAPAQDSAITISLRYASATTVDIFSGTLTAGSGWSNVTNTLAGSLPLVAAENVNTIIVTVTSKNGNNGAATQSTWVDDIVVDFTASATDSLTVTSSVNVSTTGQPGQTDVQMMYMQLNSDATGNGNCVVTDVTLHDVYIGATGTLAKVQVHLDDDNNFLNGTLGSNTITTWNGLSSLIDLTAVDLTLAERTITAGAPKFLWFLYDIEPGSSTGIQAQLQVTAIGVVAPDTAPISGPWDSNIIDINTGLGCGGCHPNPMVDGVSRDPATGGVVGDHTKHASGQGYDCELCHLATPPTARHRNELIEMRGAIGDVTNARYDKDGNHLHDSSWQQATVPVRGRCENTNCHGGINSATSYGGPTGVGPLWGTNAADVCTFCHNSNKTNAGGVANAYPSTTSPFRSTADVGAHAVHMAGAAGLMSGGVVCTDCHTVPAAVTDAGHIDDLGVAPYTQAPADVPFPVGSDARLAGYTAVYDDATVTCNVYCHSAFDAAAASTKGTATQPLWTADWANYGANSTCATACHLVPPQTPTHDNGGSWYLLSECNPCHNTSTTDTGNPPTMGAAHINGSIDATGCTGCHGTDPKQYPPVSPASGGSDGLGAHVVHIEQTSSIMTKATNEGTTASDWCAECHTSTRGAGGHDGAYPAEVAFTNAIEAKYGSTTASISPDASAVNDGNAGDCTVYCHGANMPKGDTSGTKRTPDWADTILAGACNTCHGAPPTAGSSASAHSGQAFPGSCMTCHPDTVLNTNNPPTLAPAFHIDGTVQASGCNGCHGGDNVAWSNKNFFPGGTGTTYPDRPGEHVVHINALMAKLGYSIATITDVQQKGLCDYCHNDAAGAGGTNHDDNTAPANVGTFNRIFDGAADGGKVAGYTPGNGTGGSCSNIDCHNDNSTPAAYEWYDGASTACVMCHVAGGTGTVDPLSGLHKPGTLTSSMPHDDNFASGAGCTTCHSTMSAFMTGTHGNNVNNGNATASLGLTAGMYTQTSTAGNGSGSCSGGSVAAGACHGIDTIDAGSWARLWNDTVSYQTGGAECAGCHGGFGANDWTFGSADNSTDYQVSHTKDWDAAQSSSDGAEVEGNHSGSTTVTKCNICHVYADAAYVWGTYHRDRKITMNSTMGYSGTTFNCSTNCHSETWGNTGHNLEAASSANFATRGNTLAGPALSCTGCHGALSPSAGVGTSSPHTTSTGRTCEGCHTGHTGGAVTIANNATVGINYGTGGISLGGAQAAGTTEQAICNGCHAATYQPWNVTQGGYTTGTLSNYSNWAAATWTSANFSYKPSTIQSNHYDQAAGMRCSYCHDVHDTYGTNTGTGPYLRGNWISNPFPEDGAPSPTRPGGGLFTEDADGVPRGLGASNTGSSNALGGWQIEQNNAGAYTRSGSYSTYAGVCQLCHPADTSATGILRAASFSGHAAAVDGLQAGGGNDIFNDALRGGTTSFARAYMQHNNVTVGGNLGSDYMIGLREGRYGTGIYPQVNDPKTTTIATPWGITIGASSTNVDANFHEFPCSKCHSPHMSALPRLMITNCLDVSHNTWDDSVGGNPSAWAGYGGTNGAYTAKQLAYSSTAANCHRYVDPADGNRETNANSGNGEPGWNSVTPW